MVWEYFRFQSAEGLAVGVLIISFAVIYSVLVRFMRNKGIALFISFIVSGIAAWKLYSERYYGMEAFLAFVLIVVAIAILWRYLISRFFKVFRTATRRN